MSMSSMSIESEDNGEFAAIATGERSDGGHLGTRGKEQKEKSAPDVRVEGMDDDDSSKKILLSSPTQTRDGTQLGGGRIHATAGYYAVG